MMNEILEKTFVVEEVFQHKNINIVPQDHGDNFKNLLWFPSRKRVVSISVLGKKIKEYVLPENMKDNDLQKVNNSNPVNVDKFWAILYLLIINPELGDYILKYRLQKYKIYIFHVELDSGGVVVFCIYWANNEWFMNSSTADDNQWIGFQNVYLFFE